MIHHSRVALLCLAWAIGCEEQCKNKCQRDYDDCVKYAQTTDQKAECEIARNTCLQKCPQGPQQPQYDDPQDDDNTRDQ